jgi:hypothetical protein
MNSWAWSIVAGLACGSSQSSTGSMIRPVCALENAWVENRNITQAHSKTTSHGPNGVLF